MNVENLRNKNDPILSSPVSFLSAPCEVSSTVLVSEPAAAPGEAGHAAAHSSTRVMGSVLAGCRGAGCARSRQAAAPGVYAVRTAEVWQEHGTALRKLGW